MKSTAIILALIGCLWQLPFLYRTYVWCRAGLPDGYTYPTGNEPHPREISETSWRRSLAGQRKDPGLWNDLPDTKLAVAEFRAGTTRADLVRDGFVSEGNPIRPLTAGEQTEMAAKLEQWSYYNRGLEIDLLGMFVTALVGVPWFLVTMGCTVFWCIRRQFLAIPIAWGLPVLVLPIAARVIRAVI